MMARGMWIGDLGFFSLKEEVKVRFCCWLQSPDEEWGGIGKMKTVSSQRNVAIGREAASTGWNMGNLCPI